MDEREKSIFDWLYGCDVFSELFFIASRIGDSGEIEVSPFVIGANDAFVTKYIDGGGIKEYVLNVAGYYQLKAECNDVAKENIEALQIFKSIQRWVIEKVESEEYPAFDYDILDMRATGAIIAGVDELGVKCQFQIIVRYLV